MAQDGRRFDPTSLNRFGTAGLEAVLDRLLPDPAGAVEHPFWSAVAAGLVERLGHDDFDTRERANRSLAAFGYHARSQLVRAVASDNPEVSFRADRLLAPLLPVGDVGRHVDGFRTYVESIQDRPRAELLARHISGKLQYGLPEGAARDLTAHGLGVVARSNSEAMCEFFRPMLDHPDPKVGAFVVDQIGGRRASHQFVPRLLLDSLSAKHELVVEAALSRCPDFANREMGPELYDRLRKIYLHPTSDAQKFRACYPLMYHFRDPDTLGYLLEQTRSPDPHRVRAAAGMVGEGGKFGRPVTAAVLTGLSPLLLSKNSQIRLAAAGSLGCYHGSDVIRKLIPLLSDQEPRIVETVTARLIEQRDRSHLRRMLEEAVAAHQDPIIRKKAQEVLDQLR
jgi:hypothetical protein